MIKNSIYILAHQHAQSAAQRSAAQRSAAQRSAASRAGDDAVDLRRCGRIHMESAIELHAQGVDLSIRFSSAVGDLDEAEVNEDRPQYFQV